MHTFLHVDDKRRHHSFPGWPDSRDIPCNRLVGALPTLIRPFPLCGVHRECFLAYRGDLEEVRVWVSGGMSSEHRPRCGIYRYTTKKKSSVISYEVPTRYISTTSIFDALLYHTRHVVWLCSAAAGKNYAAVRGERHIRAKRIRSELSKRRYPRPISMLYTTRPEPKGFARRAPNFGNRLRAKHGEKKHTPSHRPDSHRIPPALPLAHTASHIYPPARPSPASNRNTHSRKPHQHRGGGGGGRLSLYRADSVSSHPSSRSSTPPSIYQVYTYP